MFSPKSNHTLQAFLLLLYKTLQCTIKTTDDHKIFKTGNGNDEGHSKFSLAIGLHLKWTLFKFCVGHTKRTYSTTNSNMLVGIFQVMST